MAGGLGVAPFPLLARTALDAGLAFTWLNGAYTEHQLLPATMLPDGVDRNVCTDDGSAGTRCFVTDAVGTLLDDVATVFACGPTPMLLALARHLAAMESAPACEMSLEAPMGCALGTCLGCVVPGAAGGYLRVCVEGAVFDWSGLDWAGMAALGELVHHRVGAARLPAAATVGAQA